MPLYKKMGKPTRYIPISGVDFDCWIYSKKISTKLEGENFYPEKLQRLRILKFWAFCHHSVFAIFLISIIILALELA